MAGGRGGRRRRLVLLRVEAAVLLVTMQAGFTQMASGLFI